MNERQRPLIEQDRTPILDYIITLGLHEMGCWPVGRRQPKFPNLAKDRLGAVDCSSKTAPARKTKLCVRLRQAGLDRFLAAPLICIPLCLSLAVGALAQDRLPAGTGLILDMQPAPPPQNKPTALEMSREQAMWTALAFEDAARLRELLKQGANPNKPDELSQMTPLMAAETAEIAKILLEAGADPKLRDRAGRTVLHHAVKMREAASVVQMLVRLGADVNARADDLNKSTPLLLAIDRYLEDKDRQETSLVIRILVHLGADIDAANAKGDTPLAIAAAHNQPELIRLLMELGADPSHRMVNGLTPLDYAREANAEEAMQALAAAASALPPAN
jgi:hypothetical protein